MKPVRILIFILALCLLLSVSAAATGLTGQTVVEENGSCRVELTLHLDDEASVFPIPADATDVTVNGVAAQGTLSGGRLLVPVSGGSCTLSYTLAQVVTLNKKTATVTLQLLCGAETMLDRLEFQIILPADVAGLPTFTSGYYQEQIASFLVVSVEGNVIHGVTTAALKDHETLTVTFETDASAFAAMQARKPLLSAWEWAIAACVLAAVIYYCATLMPRLTRPVRCSGSPDGITAGELGTCLTACGTDLTMLVISWAQMGYLIIEIDGEDHVTLHKRMDMGNERSHLEMRCFQDLFNRRSRVDGTGQHYARICRKMESKSVLLRQLYQPDSGSPRLFRLLMTLPAVVFGVQVGVALGTGGGTKTVFAICLAAACAVLSYFIQSGGKCLPLRDKMPLLLCLGCGILWVTLGLAAGRAVMAGCMVVLQFIAGVAAAYGGKRSALGVQALAQIRGLRNHLRTAKTSELQVLMGKNPDYFYEMAPYALALGLDRRFARSLGKTPLPENSYLDVGAGRPMTAYQWAAELRFAADILNRSKKRLRYSNPR